MHNNSTECVKRETTTGILVGDVEVTPLDMIRWFEQYADRDMLLRMDVALSIGHDRINPMRPTLQDLLGAVNDLEAMLP